jgi:hypothetical protein
LKFVAQHEHVLVAPLLDKDLFAPVSVCSRITNTTLPVIVVRAFIGPRPVYLRIILTIVVDMAEVRAPPCGCSAAVVSVATVRPFSPFPEVI